MAVESNFPSVSVIAGAGSGKTTTIVERIRYLLSRGCEPREIVALTFTRRAADEMRQRLGPSADRCFIGTFHQVACRLMEHKSRVLDESEANALLESCITDGKPVSYWRKKADASANLPTVNAYRSQLAIRGEIDYHGLLEWLLTYSTLWYPRHVIIDEAQDNEPIQWSIVDKLVDNGAHMYLVADPLQAIYEWRGAKIEDFLLRSFNRIHISESFRIPSDVCDLANCLAARAGCDMPRLRTTNKRLGLFVASNECDAMMRLLDHYEPEEIAVITRTNMRAQQVRQDLELHGIQVSSTIQQETPYFNILKGVAYPRSLTVEMVASLLPGLPVTTNAIPELIQHWLQTFNVQNVGDALKHIKLSDEFEEEKCWLNNFFAGLPLREAVSELALASRELRRTPGVTVDTTHQVKGLEYSATVLAFDAGGFSEEAMRVRYVAATRCKEICIVIDSDPVLTEEALKVGATRTEVLATPF